MLTRILTAAVGVVIFFAAVLAPWYVFAFALLAVTAVMLAEMYKVLSCGRAVNGVGFAAATVAAAGMICDAAQILHGGMFKIACVLFVMIYLALTVAMHTKQNAKDILAHGFITFFITVFMFCIIKLRMINIYSTILVFLIAWMTDSGAYFAGVFLGKHKLVPHISPKKTVEGAIGGLMAAVAGCVAYYAIISAIGGTDIKIYLILYYAVIGLIGSALSQLGDFAASCIKRDYNVKDYGNILPGHGGLMDRFDSVVFIAPFVYFAISANTWLNALMFLPEAHNSMLWSILLG